MDFYKSIIETSPFGYAYHKIIRDQNNNPCDYEFIEVNIAFEKATGLKGIDIIGRKFTEVFQDIKKSEFDLILFYGDIEINCRKKEIEKFSQRSNKLYKININFIKNEYFAVHYIEISKDKGQSYEIKNLQEEKANRVAELVIANKELAFESEEKANRAAELIIIKELAFENEEKIKLLEELAVSNKELQKSKDRISNILEGTNAGTWEWNVQTGEITLNERWAQIIGYTLAEISPVSIENMNSFVHTEDLKISKAQLKQVFDRELDFYDVECRLKHKDGSLVWTLDRAKVMSWTPDGKPLIMSGTHTDIADRKQTEEQLHNSEEKFRLLFERMTNGFTLQEVVFDEQGEPVDFKFLMVNRAYEMQMNLRCQDAVGKTMLEIYPAADKEMIQKYCKVGLTGETLHMEYYSNEVNRYFNSFSYRHQIGLFATIFEDITQRKQMEEELAIISARLELAIKAASIGIWEYDIVNGTLIWDDAMYGLFDINKETFSGTYEAWEQRLHPDDIQSARQQLNNILIGTRDYNEEFRVVWNDGSVHHIQSDAVVLRDKQGTPIKMLGTNLDITEKKQLISDLKKAIVTKDEFLTIITHELKTPIAVINSAIQAMEFICKNELSDKSKGFIDKIKRNSNRQLKLVNNLLDFTRIKAGYLKVHKTNIDIVLLSRAITESIIVYAEQKCIQISFSSTINNKVIGIDEEKYERILLNLLSNAIKFTEKDKSITVSVSKKILAGKSKVCIQVRDQGVGIPKDKRALIFERFGQVDSSLTRQAEGTGIGLSLVKMLVKLLDGEILLESKEGVGSMFTVLLPITKVIGNSNEQMIQEICDNRLIQATTIEFSDVYMY